MSERIFIGLGANLGDPERQIEGALEALAALGAVVQVSPLYRTRPWGVSDQPWFVNAVAEISTGMAPADLLAALLAIEARHGRVRGGARWGPRRLDLDLLAYGERRVETAELEVPHPRLAERAFVLVPWSQIAPEFVVPGLDSVGRLAARCPDREGVEPISEEQHVR